MHSELKQFVPFCVVGGIGFIVDAGILALMVHGFGVGPLVSRLVSFPCAMTTTWYLNRKVTFSSSAADRTSREWVRYALVSITGNMVNFGIYVLCIGMFQVMYDFPEFALAIAAAVALFFNYIGASRFVFTAEPGK